MAKLAQKQEIALEIKEKLAKATSVVLVDSRGLTVEQDTVLRKKLRDSGVDYRVYKNSTMDFAVEGTAFEGLKPFFKGPSAMAISYGEATLASRVISKELKAMPILRFKGGVLDNVVYDADGMLAVSNIPSREELLSKFLGSIKAPMASFARVAKAIAEKSE